LCHKIDVLFLTRMDSCSSKKNLAGGLFNALKKTRFFFWVIYWFLSPANKVGEPLIILYGRVRNERYIYYITTADYQ
jgi:hypothetical protein